MLELILGLSPFERPDPGLVSAVGRAGALGVLDLGRERAIGLEAMGRVRTSLRRFGVRIPSGADFSAGDVTGAAVVVLPAGADLAAWRAPARALLVQVTRVDQARAALVAGATGLIAKGNESGGRVDEESSFVLLQHLKDVFPQAELWVQGGIGLHTAAACIAGGARGVVLDSQLALLDESTLPHAVRAILQGLDGSETAVVGGHRILLRPGLAAPSASADAEEIERRLGARDLAVDLLPAGQDVAFARPLAERFKNAAGLIPALRRAIDGHLRQARALNPLAPSSPLAVELGTLYPIAQGPMSRVSDTSAFAEAVSAAGALPFVALSLARGAEARSLLTEVKQAHERTGRSWGVGILGFVTPELVEEQFALLRELRPPVVLVAGGRPAQAQVLEQAGIRCFLHVPSPGLLDLFLSEGARRFVLEGRECGGHVGPRTSFVLWERAIERLLNDPHVDETSVLFAGGVHDARSAAMVAAAAAPLAARGARIGVLMGTAYVFTDEAVVCGALKPGFQELAIACDRTVVLETGPGHATRCADTDYVRAFRAERERLERDGQSAKEVWEALEQLNLGRLRIAAKGVRRDGVEFSEVDEQTQRREGMFMLGQVAALRHQRCSMAELHREVSEGSGRLIAAVRLDALAAKPVDVAIVGMAAVFPGAADLPAYWRNVLDGTASIGEVPPERWNTDLYYDPKGTGDKTPSRWGAFLPEIAFDPASYGIPPRSLASIEPVQVLALEVARRALDDAGYLAREFDRDRASVIFGAEAGTDLSAAYGFRASHRQLLGELPEALDKVLPKLTEDSFPGVLSNVIAGRIANRLDLGGVNFTVDAACASSLAALDIACKELSQGTSDLVLCGGADLHNGIGDFLMFASVHALSATGQCRPFDAAADGIVLGEGVAAVVLKRLADAERDGDRIYAVIKGVGGSSDGKSLGLTAPRREGQMRALERAYERAGVSPAEVELVEAHGTGTVVGDRTELATLAEVFGGAGALPGRVTLGSVKSLIGHTKCAAGMAGLIKTALSIYSRVLPPTTHVKHPNPGYEGTRSPFLFREAAHPWPSERRLAGVSAFGFGGTNFHVVLSAPPTEAAPPCGLLEWPAELFLFRAPTLAAALEVCAQLESIARNGKPYRLRDLAAGVAAKGSGPVQVAFVADSLSDLATRCLAAREGRAGRAGVAGDGVRGGAVAMLFPGQGSQRPGMLADLMVAFPQVQEPLRLGRRWADRIYPRAPLTPEERAAQAAALTDTRVAQPALGIVDLAAAQLLRSFGVEGAMLGGHSYGELVALCVAGVMQPKDLLELSEARANCILQAARGAPGSMAAVRDSAENVEKALGPDREGVVLANLNAPDQVVIAGPDADVEAACARLSAAGKSCRRLQVACAFHSPVVAKGAEYFAQRLQPVALCAPDRPVFANSTAAPYPADLARLRELLAGQIARPVRFTDEIEAMYAAGARVFVEAGPGSVLTNLVERILGERPHLAVAAAGEPGLKPFLNCLAALAVAGVSVDPTPLFAGRDVQPIDPASPPHIDPPATAWMVNGQRARPVSGELPDFAMRPVVAPVATARDRLRGTNERDATVLEYLHSMREMVADQKQVMLRYLGAPPSAETSAAQPEAAPRAQKQTEAPAVSTPARRDEKLNPMEVLIAIVSERTGYPKELLDPDLDLEANLGIDSIKRIEVLGALGEKLALGFANIGKRSEMIEKLASVKTLRGIATAFEERAKDGAASAEVGAEPPKKEPDLNRYVLSVEPLPAAVPNGAVLNGRQFALTDDGRGLAPRLAALLKSRGASVQILTGDELPTSVDGLVHLSPLAAQPSVDPRKALFGLAKQAVLNGASCVVAATALGGAFQNGEASPVGARWTPGIAGLLRAVALEWPDLRVRSVGLDLAEGSPAEAFDRSAADLLAEILSDAPCVEVGYKGGVRHGAKPVLTPVEAGAATPLELGLEHVVLVTGGARGITAAAALELARRYGCSLELVGRSPSPSPEESDVAACPDAPALRRLLVGRDTAHGARPDLGAIEVEIARIVNAREIRKNLETLKAALGERVRYHAVDVRDRVAFGSLIDEIYARHGRLDGVIHGAGVIEDKLLRDKTRESFDRVFDTKVEGAQVLLDKLRPDVRFVVFFSSISGVFGNRGQVDYAAANDALDKLAHQLRRKVSGRVVSIGWGPWAGAGMMSKELEKEYERRGIGVIRPEEGVLRLIDEVVKGSQTQVILMRATPERLLAGPAPAGSE